MDDVKVENFSKPALVLYITSGSSKLFLINTWNLDLLAIFLEGTPRKGWLCRFRFVHNDVFSVQDVAVKVFTKQEYSDEVIYSFKQEVSLFIINILWNAFPFSLLIE